MFLSFFLSNHLLSQNSDPLFSQSLLCFLKNIILSLYYTRLEDAHFIVQGREHVCSRSSVTLNPASPMQNSYFMCLVSVLEISPWHGLGSLVSFCLWSEFPLISLLNSFILGSCLMYVYYIFNLLQHFIICPNPLFFDMPSIYIRFCFVTSTGIFPSVFFFFGTPWHSGFSPYI